MTLPHLLAAALSQALDPLDRDAELRAFAARDLDTLARTQIRYVISRALHFARAGRIDREEAFLHGMEGLAVGLAKFDPSHGTRVNTYISIWVNRYITNLLELSGTPLAGARTSRTSMFFTLRKLTSLLEGAEDEAAVIREFVRTDLRCVRGVVSVERMTALLAMHRTGQPVSLDAPRHHDLDSDDWHEHLASGGESPELEYSRAESQHEARTRIEAALRVLPPREQVIIRLTLLCHEDEKVTLQSLGDMFGVSRERARQLQVKALAKLRRVMKAPAIVRPKRVEIARIGPRRAQHGGRKPLTITHDGITLTASQWAKRIGVGVSTIYQRRSIGLPIERVLSGPTPSSERVWKKAGGER